MQILNTADALSLQNNRENANMDRGGALFLQCCRENANPEPGGRTFTTELPRERTSVYGDRGTCLAFQRPAAV